MAYLLELPSIFLLISTEDAVVKICASFSLVVLCANLFTYNTVVVSTSGCVWQSFCFLIGAVINSTIN